MFHFKCALRAHATAMMPVRRRASPLCFLYHSRIRVERRTSFPASLTFPHRNPAEEPGVTLVGGAKFVEPVRTRGTCQGGPTSRSCPVRAHAAWVRPSRWGLFRSLWSLSSSVGPTTGCLPPSRHSSIADGTVQPCAPTIPGFRIAPDRACSDRLRGPALGPFLLARTLPPPRTDQSE